MGDCGCEFEASGDDQRRTLRIVLAINAMMFVAEIVAGLLADSAGLIADSLDMLADACVYAISLYAVGRAPWVRQFAAKGSGLLQMTLGTGVLIEAIRRYCFGAEPIGWTMIATAAVALLANAICLRLLWKHRRGDVNFRASYIFSANDVIANVGVMISGALVLSTGSQVPDLAIGFLIAIVVLRGGMKIRSEASREVNTPANDVEKEDANNG